MVQTQIPNPHGSLVENMPGIVGLITKRPRQWAEIQLQQMIAALRHLPSYTFGTWTDEALGVYVGWVARR